MSGRLDEAWGRLERPGGGLRKAAKLVEGLRRPRESWGSLGKLQGRSTRLQGSSREAPGRSRKVQETPGGSRKFQKVPGGSGEAAGHYKRFQEATGGSRRLLDKCEFVSASRSLGQLLL